MADIPQATALPSQEQQYQSVYKGAIVENGEFVSFKLEVSRHRYEYGFWRFVGKDLAPGNELAAYKQGFTSPEGVIVSELRDRGSTDHIQLYWQPGSKDTHKFPRFGNAQYHLGTMDEELQRLGATVNWEKEMPTYPLDPQQKLLHFRRMRGDRKYRGPGKKSTASPTPNPTPTLPTLSQGSPLGSTPSDTPALRASTLGPRLARAPVLPVQNPMILRSNAPLLLLPSSRSLQSAYQNPTPSNPSHLAQRSDLRDIDKPSTPPDATEQSNSPDATESSNPPDTFDPSDLLDTVEPSDSETSTDASGRDDSDGDGDGDSSQDLHASEHTEIFPFEAGVGVNEDRPNPPYPHSGEYWQSYAPVAAPPSPPTDMAKIANSIDVDILLQQMELFDARERGETWAEPKPQPPPIWDIVSGPDLDDLNRNWVEEKEQDVGVDYTSFPCIECGDVKTHKQDCAIGSIALRRAGELSTLQLNDIAEMVERNDPGSMEDKTEDESEWVPLSFKQPDI